ncbi:MAG: MoaD/ThiS family protein [Alphaproteobacteria bacterium]|nr:MoaD/ThiS family protein [Alphaproteobacteria bacterium]
MRITVRTGGILHRYLPAGSTNNTAVLEIEEGDGPLDVLRRLGFPEGQRFLVTVNGISIPTTEREATRLAESDDLGIFPPLKGG